MSRQAPKQQAAPEASRRQSARGASPALLERASEPNRLASRSEAAPRVFGGKAVFPNIKLAGRMLPKLLKTQHLAQTRLIIINMCAKLLEIKALNYKILCFCLGKIGRKSR